MPRKNLKLLKSSVENREVVLNFYRTHWYINDEKDGVSPLRKIRIYRMQIDDFIFGPDHDEFFDGIIPSDDDIIYNDSLEPVCGAKYSFTDSDVEVGKVYAYWVAAAEGFITGPVAVKIRDENIWWPYEKTLSFMRDLEKEFSDQVKVELIGHTVGEREICSISIGRGEKAMGLVGAVHAGESGAELMLPALRKLLEDRSEIFSNLKIVAVPLVNIDEREKMVKGYPGYCRVNANGVDLNRNFNAGWDDISYNYGLDSSDPDSVTYRGMRPESEPETKALAAFFEQNKVDVLFSFHCLASICGAKFLAPACVKKGTDFADKCEDFAKEYAVGMFEDIDPEKYEITSIKKEGDKGTSGGSLPMWLKEKGIPAFDLEINGEYEIDALEKCRYDNTDLSLLEEYQSRHYNGISKVIDFLLK